jgi:hypothetical protein
VFRRRQSQPGQQVAEDLETTVAEESTEGTESSAADEPAAAPATTASRANGPFDADEIDQADHVDRADFGSLRVPVVEATEIRAEVEEATGAVQTITVVTADSSMQLGVFAAPRKAGIWDEVRTGLAAGITSSGGMAGEHDGEFGTELRAKVPFEDNGKRGLTAARFVGVDGPRWFVRGVLTGQAAENDDAAAPLLTVLRGSIVVRGSDPRAPHEGLPLQLPKQSHDHDAESAAGPDLNPFRRGPEITEIR